jgi:hypothetical protein
MTAHELARKLLEMPDIEVRVFDPGRGYDNEFYVRVFKPNHECDWDYDDIDSEFVGIW